MMTNLPTYAKDEIYGAQSQFVGQQDRGSWLIYIYRSCSFYCKTDYNHPQEIEHIKPATDADLKSKLVRRK